MKVVYSLVMLGLVACVVARPAELTEEEKKLAANFGFQDGQTPPPGALAGPAGPVNHAHPSDSDSHLATNFGLEQGQTPPPGTLAGPKSSESDEASKLAANFGLKEGQTPPPGTLASPSKSVKI